MMVILSNSDDDSASTPWWISYWCYALCSVFLMTIPYRLAFFRATAHRQWSVTKRFSTRPVETDEPLYSLKKAKDPLLSKIVQAGANVCARRGAADDADDDDEESAG